MIFESDVLRLVVVVSLYIAWKMAAFDSSKMEGHIDEFGIERFFYTSELLSEKLYVVAEHLSEEEQRQMTIVHQSEVPALISTKMDSFPFFYFFPQNYTHCTATAADLEAMEEIFSEEFNSAIKWPSGKSIAHCPFCGHSDVYMGRFCIQPMVKGYFEGTDDSEIGAESLINICTHFIPRIFHEKCYKQLANQAESFGIVFPIQADPKHLNTPTGFEFSTLTEQWLKVQKLVRALDGKIRLSFIPGALFSAADRKHLADAVCLAKFLQHLTYQKMVHIADIAGLELEARKEDFECSSQFPTDAEYFSYEGNRAMSSKDFNAAINFFTKSILACPCNYVFWSQRSIALSGLRRFEESLLDCEECIKLNPKWLRGYLIKALSQLTLEWYDDALTTLIQAGNLDPMDADAANKLLTAVKLSYKDTGIIHYVNVVEDERYEKLHAFLALICQHICQMCKIETENTKDDGIPSLPIMVTHTLTLDTHNAAKLAYRLNALDIPEVKKYEEVFKNIAGSALNDLVKTRKAKKATKAKTKGKQAQNQTKKSSSENKIKNARLAALQKRECDVLRQLKTNKEKDDNAKANSKNYKKKSVWISLKKSLYEERKCLQHELEIVRKCKGQVEEDFKRETHKGSISCEVGMDLKRHNQIPCSKKYTPEQLRALPWRLIEKALKNGLLKIAKLDTCQDDLWKVSEPFSDVLTCGSHSPVGVVLAEFILGSYNNVTNDIWNSTDDVTVDDEEPDTFGSHLQQEPEEKLIHSVPGIGQEKLSFTVEELSKGHLFPINMEGLPNIKDFDTFDEGMSHMCLHIDNYLPERAVQMLGRRKAASLLLGMQRDEGDELMDAEETFHDALSSLEDLRLDPEFCSGPEDISEMDGVVESSAEEADRDVHGSKRTPRDKQRRCANCAAEKKHLGKCGKCKRVYYCSQECQKLHHIQHKQDCK